MNSRERIKNTFNFKVPDRIGIFDAPWPETVARWRMEGLPANVHVNEYFNYDVDDCIFLDTSIGLKEKIIASTEDYITFTNMNGVTHKVMRGRTCAPFVLDYLIKDEDDWKACRDNVGFSRERIKIYHWGEYETVTEKRFDPSIFPDSWDATVEKYKKARARNKFIFFVASGPFENTRNCIRAETVYMDMIENPGYIQRIFKDFTDLIVDAYVELCKMGLEADGFFIADDIAYKNGMLFSPDMYRELLFPFHKQLCEFFRSKGLPVMFHTDGKLDVCLPLLIEAGITAIQPIEAKVGNDVRKLKGLYGDRLVFVGNIDVQKLSGTPKDIEEEIESKILAVKQNGGYIYHSDHSVPPSISFKNYQHAIELVRKYGGY